MHPSFFALSSSCGTSTAVSGALRCTAGAAARKAQRAMAALLSAMDSGKRYWASREHRQKDGGNYGKTLGNVGKYVEHIEKYGKIQEKYFEIWGTYGQIWEKYRQRMGKHMGKYKENMGKIWKHMAKTGVSESLSNKNLRFNQ